MNLSQRFYPGTMIMRSTDPGTLRIIDLWKFRSRKSNKWYIVEVEHFPFHFYGLKFYWKGVASSKERYSLLTNDFEPRTIVMSCINIMMHYFKKDELASFGFVGAHDILAKHILSAPNKRFRFYRRMMLTLFSNDRFIQANDRNSSMYLLINKQILADKKITLARIESEISKLFVGDYSFVIEP